MKNIKFTPGISSLIDWVKHNEITFVQFGINTIAAVIILTAGVFLSRIISSGLRRILRIKEVDETIIQFSTNIVRYAVVAFSLVAALGRIGIETTSIIAVIGAAGLAVGLALQGSLSNFAAGILLVSLRPFKSGELVQFGNTIGSVVEINIFFTYIKAADNKIIAVPNGKVIASEIINYSRHPHRRVEIIVSVGYNTDSANVKNVLMNALDGDERILHDLGKTVRMNEMSNSSINYVVRAWVQNIYYWDVYFDLMENIKKVLDENEISIPYPQMDIHLHKART